MFRQKSVLFSLLAAVLVVVVACTTTTTTSTTVPPPTSTPVATATPTPEPTPIPAPITTDPTIDPVGFFDALPSTEASCVAGALGGRDRVLTLLESALEADPISPVEASSVEGCISDETVQRVLVGQLDREAGGLSEATVNCINEQSRGLSAATLFGEEPAADAAISLLQGVFCLNPEERSAVSSSEAASGFGEFGGIDALECVVNGVGPTGLDDLMGVLSSASADGIDLSAASNLFPLLVECGAVDDTALEETGISVDQVGCLLNELGDSGLALLNPDAGDPDLGDLTEMFAALETCGIDLQDLMDGASLPPEMGGTGVVVGPTAEVGTPENTPGATETPVATDVELPFSDEQIACLADELGADAITDLLAGGAPDLTLFSALDKCGIDVLSLLGS